MAKQKNKFAPNDVYTALLASAAGVVFLTAIYVTIKCISEYGSLL